MFKPTDRQQSLFSGPQVLGEAGRKRLAGTWAEGFRELVFPLLLACEGEFADLYTPKVGRGNWSVARKLGVLVLSEWHDLSDQAALDSLTWDLRWQHALGLGLDEGYLSRRSLVEFRSRLVGQDPSMTKLRQVFERVGEAALAGLGLSASEQRLDSTRITSNIRQRGRVSLFRNTLEHFGRWLAKTWPEKVGELSESLRAWLATDRGGWFGDGTKDEQQRKLAELAQWLGEVEACFAADEAVRETEPYLLVVRLLDEHCERVKPVRVGEGTEPGEAGTESAVEAEPAANAEPTTIMAQAVDPAPAAEPDEEPAAPSETANEPVTPESAVADSTPETAVESAAAPSTPETAVESAVADSTPETAVESAAAPSTPETAVESAVADSTPETAVESAAAPSTPETAVESAAADSTPEIAAESAAADSTPEIAAESAAAESTPEAAAETAPAPPAVTVLKKPSVKGASMQSPYDPDAGYGHKGSGYHVQIAETCKASKSADKPSANIITAFSVNPANVSDCGRAAEILEDLAARGLTPERLFADGGYACGEALLHAKSLGVDLRAPMTRSTMPADTVGREAFVFEPDGRVRSCPKGHAPKRHGLRSSDNEPEPTLHAFFDGTTCRACPLLGRCAVRKPNNGKRGDHHLELIERLFARDKACERQQTHAWRSEYKIRSGIEATNSELKGAHGLGKLRVRRMPRVLLAVTCKLTACNIKRWLRAAARALFSHLSGVPARIRVLACALALLDGLLALSAMGQDHARSRFSYPAP